MPVRYGWNPRKGEAHGGREVCGMERELKSQKYEDYMADVSAAAAAAGRREPYHLTYLKRYGERSQPKEKRRLDMQKVPYDR